MSWRRVSVRVVIVLASSFAFLLVSQDAAENFVASNSDTGFSRSLIRSLRVENSSYDPWWNFVNVSSKNSSGRTGCPTFPSPPAFQGKKGACLKNITKVQMLKPYWNYNWTANPTRFQPDNIEFVPMIWHGKNLVATQKSLNRIMRQNVSAQRLLGFNEPDSPKQANMAVEQAVAAWPYLEATGLPLVSPSCVRATGPWMQEFMQVADAKCLRVDYIGVHWYGGIGANSFKSSMRSIYEFYDRRPLIVTEFAPADWSANSPENNSFSRKGVLNFMKEVLPWLEEQDWIAGYAWFPFGIKSAVGTSSALFDQSGHLTALGRFYASVNANNTTGDQSIVV